MASPGWPLRGPQVGFKLGPSWSRAGCRRPKSTRAGVGSLPVEGCWSQICARGTRPSPRWRISQFTFKPRSAACSRWLTCRLMAVACRGVQGPSIGGPEVAHTLRQRLGWLPLDLVIRPQISNVKPWQGRRGQAWLLSEFGVGRPSWRSMRYVKK